MPVLVYPAQPTADAVAAQDPSASGYGNIHFGTGLTTFSFSAVRQEDGSMTGQAALQNRAGGFSIITRLIVCGSTATRRFISGVAARSTDPTLVGASAIFSVQDDGEGPGDPPDMPSRVDRLCFPLRGATSGYGPVALTSEAGCIFHKHEKGAQ